MKAKSRDISQFLHHSNSYSHLTEPGNHLQYPAFILCAFIHAFPLIYLSLISWYYNRVSV